jgi:hypothetical protein
MGSVNTRELADAFALKSISMLKFDEEMTFKDCLKILYPRYGTHPPLSLCCFFPSFLRLDLPRQLLSHLVLSSLPHRATKRELEQMFAWTQHKPVPPELVRKIKNLFDELDTDFTSKVRLGDLYVILSQSHKLLSVSSFLLFSSLCASSHPLFLFTLSFFISEYIPRFAKLTREELMQKVSLPELLTRLFIKTHRQSLPTILSYAKPSKPLSATQLKGLRLCSG